ncbi:MAG TPA: hypothetical protein VL357_05370 [Rariglobus sp.]|jgi:curli biogenesis system outer membrane secretion channel CsgG|nr:hypothetical protein [Rariglobus sp.]
MKFFKLLSLAALALVFTGAAIAQDAPGKKKLAITKIAATDSVKARMAKQGGQLSLASVLDALDSQVYDRVLGTKRFEILERSDADALTNEAQAAGKTLQFQQADYVLTIRVDGFNDRTETRTLAALGKTVAARVIELSAVAKITEVSTQRAIVSTNFQVTRREADQLSANTVQKNGEESDILLTDATREMARKIASRVADAVFPARIIGKRDKVVTINRNDTSGIKVGQIWEVFTLGDELVDPDTGDKSREEISVGTVKISRVTPQNSQAEILTDTGIDRLAVVRLKVDVPDQDE